MTATARPEYMSFKTKFIIEILNFVTIFRKFCTTIINANKIPVTGFQRPYWFFGLLNVYTIGEIAQFMKWLKIHTFNSFWAVNSNTRLSVCLLSNSKVGNIIAFICLHSDFLTC